MSHQRQRTGQVSAAITLSLMIAAGAALPHGNVEAAFIQQTQFGARLTIAVAWGDADGDGDLDLAVGNNSGGNELYVNNGDGTFTGQDQFFSGPFGTTTFVVLWGDYDNDGDADMAVGNFGPNKLFTNNGNGTYTESNQFGGGNTPAMAWGDYDRDGDLDLAVGNGILGVDEQNYLYVNNGDGTFTQQAQFGINQTQAVVWGDCDNDGDLDLAVGNGGFGFIQQNFLYRNDGGTFVAIPDFGTGDTTSLDWGDFDNDGDLDLAVGNWNNTQSALYVNNGNCTFAGHAEFGARDTNTVVWGDADNDGLLDLAVGNGDFTSAEQNYLYLNNGDGTFTELPEFGLGSTDSLAWGDYDGDGDLDVAAGNEHSPSTNYLYVNDVGGPYLRLHLVGHRHDHGTGHSNRDAIGARVIVYEPGFLGDPAHRLGLREVSAHGGFASQNAIDPHFGLPGMTTVDVRIVWPGSGGSNIVTDLTAVPVNQVLTVHEAPPITVVPPIAEQISAVACTTDIECRPAGSPGSPSQARCIGGRCYGPKNRYISFVPNTLLPLEYKVYKVPSGAPIGWVSAPDGAGMATVVAGPVSRTWPEAVIHVGDCEIVPAAEYVIRASDGVADSAPLTLPTIAQPAPKFWGDTVGGFSGSWEPANGVVNVNDFVAALQRFQSLPTAPHVSIVDVVGAGLPGQEACLNRLGNVSDVFNLIKAFQGQAYPFTTDPGSCPVCP